MERNRVQILDDAVVNQIAAGEVVERPSSVIKELVENSIDAAATEITVVIANGGKSAIEVIDNGCGMPRADALIAIERFGTSKLRAVSDLETVQTLGFRGEALPSIASVSQFSLITRSAENDLGVKITIDGGKLGNVEEMSCPVGTRVSVHHLFYNVPARKRFLRSEQTEAGLIKTLLTDFACSHPRLRLRLVSDGKEALLFTPVEQIFARLSELKWFKTKPILVRQSYQISGSLVEVQAVLSQPIESLGGSGKLRLLVNNRAVRDRLLLRAIHQGYGTFLKGGRYPSGVLHLRIRPEEIDINVHPQKAEIRFRSSQQVFQIVSQAISEALSSVPPVAEGPLSLPLADSRTIPSPALGRGHYAVFEGASESWNLARERRPSYDFRGNTAIVTPVAREGSFPERISQMRFVGQIFDCYLLLEGNNRLIIVDMHAAHERITFYLLKKQLAQGALKQQLLLVPEVIEVPPALAEKFSHYQPLLYRLGFDCDLFGENSVAVRSQPALLNGKNVNTVFADLFSISEWSDWEAELGKRLDLVVARLACHASIRSGDRLEKEEVYRLLEALEEAEGSGFCPHGRPVSWGMSESELEQVFGRGS